MNCPPPELSPYLQRDLDLLMLGRALNKAVDLGRATTWDPMMAMDAERVEALLLSHGIRWDASERGANPCASARLERTVAHVHRAVHLDDRVGRTSGRRPGASTPTR